MPRIGTREARRQAPDRLLTEIADYVAGYEPRGEEARRIARYCLLDTLGCAMLALDYPACTKLLGPVVPGAECPTGARVPGTRFRLDPVTAAFNIGTMLRWLDYNDTWLAAEWGHPSDNLGAILAVADYVHDRAGADGSPLRVRDVLTAMIKAHEIQGVLALKNSFNEAGIDHVVLVRVASTAVATAMLGGTREQIVNAVSNAWMDGGTLRAYRHAPNTGTRKSWAAGDAASRAVRLALLSLRGEMGYPTVLSAEVWGYEQALLHGRRIELGRPLGSYVMENVLFKIAYPAEFHAQTAVEAAIALHPHVAGRLDDIEKITLQTQEAGVRIIDKTGDLANPADRDHCLQYMVAVALIFGRLVADDYEDRVARDPRIDALRAKMQVTENPEFSRDYLDPAKRAIANAVQVFFADGSCTERIAVHYPVGHRRRREEGIPLLLDKFHRNLSRRFAPQRVAAIEEACADQAVLEAMPVSEFIELWVE